MFPDFPEQLLEQLRRDELFTPGTPPTPWNSGTQQGTPAGPGTLGTGTLQREPSLLLLLLEPFRPYLKKGSVPLIVRSDSVR